MHNHCAKHQAHRPACPICHRIGIENDLTTRTVDALLAAGHALQINDGDELRPEVPTRDRQVMIDELGEVDDEFLTAFFNGENMPEGKCLPDGYVRFVYGNDGYDVISDYTTNLEALLAPVNAAADALINDPAVNR